MTPAILVFLVPVAITAGWLFWYGRLFDKSTGSYRARDFLSAMAVLCVGSFATIMAALFSWYAYTQLS